MFPYDPQLLTLAESSPQTVAEVVKTLQGIDAICVDQDGLKWFNWLYLRITEAVGARVAASEGLKDSAWLATLDVQFAGFYFEALRSCLAQESASRNCWGVLFERRNDTRLTRLQFALAGVNAHINHDLCAAIVATCELTGTTPRHRGPEHADYTAVNSTLDSQIDAAERELNVSLLGDRLPLMKPIEFKVAVSREKAWLNAEGLWHLRSTPELAANYLDVIDGLTTAAGRVLLL